MDRIYRVLWNGDVRYAVERDGELRLAVGGIFDGYTLGDRIAVRVSNDAFDRAVPLLAPIEPTKIVAIGLNYKDHAAEQGKPLPKEPMLFLKPSTAVIGPGAAIELPPGVGRVDHEAEMALVIGRRATRVRAADAGAHIFGVTCSNDVTARDMQNRGYQYSHVKGFDTFAALGPAVVVGLNPDDLAVEGWVNGTKRQGSRTHQLVFSAAELVEYISHIMTLLPGDVISTGTPSGIGPLADGDTVTVTVEGVGSLTNPVRNRA
jgi:2-keto-4-pentenoate hydratase/2-oxohepta-3-ene-1,7-dioic acid hydratase in catechol pathway